MVGASPPVDTQVGHDGSAPSLAPLFSPVPAQLPKGSPQSLWISLIGHGAFCIKSLQLRPAPNADPCCTALTCLRFKARANLGIFLRRQRLAQQPTCIGFRGLGPNDLQMLTLRANAKQRTTACRRQLAEYRAQALSRCSPRRGRELLGCANY